MLFVFAPLQAIGFKVFQVLGFVSALGLIGGVFLMSGSPAVAAAGRTRHGYCFISPNVSAFAAAGFWAPAPAKGPSGRRHSARQLALNAGIACWTKLEITPPSEA
jgi:hypothetical protein